jgi:ubiquinone/menaquinone biosynthesis C-methylase UbiE
MSQHHGGRRFPPERRNVLKDEERLRTLPPKPLLEAAGFTAGDSVLDIGAGTGFWTAPLGEIVGPEGRVIALDVEPIMLDELRDLVSTRGLVNIETVQSEDMSIP